MALANTTAAINPAYHKRAEDKRPGFRAPEQNATRSVGLSD
jgi:hypothetical protein